MVTLDARHIDDALLERAHSGAAGWSTAEVLRAEAERLLADEADCPQGRLGEQAEHLLQNALAIARPRARWPGNCAAPQHWPNCGSANHATAKHWRC
jgi:hypothetical protein